MYQITHFDKKLCHWLHDKLNLITGDCNSESIPQSNPRITWKSVVEFITKTSFGGAEWFSVLYWMLFVISILGTAYSFMGIANLFWGDVMCISKRKYDVVPCCLLWKGRTIYSLVMLNAWLLLLYALVNVSPCYMMPWITITIVFLVADVASWIFEVLTKSTKMDFKTVLTFAVPIFNLLLVNNIRNVFESGIEANDIEYLLFWKQSPI